MRSIFRKTVIGLLIFSSIAYTLVVAGKTITGQVLRDEAGQYDGGKTLGKYYYYVSFDHMDYDELFENLESFLHQKKIEINAEVNKIYNRIGPHASLYPDMFNDSNRLFDLYDSHEKLSFQVVDGYNIWEAFKPKDGKLKIWIVKILIPIDNDKMFKPGTMFHISVGSYLIDAPVHHADKTE